MADNRTMSCFVRALAVILGVLIPGSWAGAETSKEDWKVTSSVTPSVYDTDGKLSFNAARCADLFDIGTGDVAFIFTLSDPGLLTSDASFSIKFAHGNEKCDEASLDREPEDVCHSELNRRPLTSSSSPIEIRIPVDELGSATSAGQCENLSETSYLYLIVSDRVSSEATYTVRYALDFRTARPQAPTGIRTVAGGESVKVSWNSVPGADTYNVYYSSSAAISVGDKPEDLDMKVQSSASTSVTLKNGISADTVYAITVTSVDSDGNESLVGEVVTAETVEAKDFWQSYREQNMDAEGGFCFIATAAYGSVQEPHVRVLRRFRDTVLMKSDAGRSFVETYYRISPPAANYISRHPVLRAAVRTALWPVYGMAWLSMEIPAAFYGILVLLFVGVCFGLYRIVGRISCGRRTGTLSAVVAASAVLPFGMLAASSDACAESPVDMMFEFKAGTYSPDGLGDAYDAHFGSDGGFLVEGELDYQIWRGIGSAGVGISLGYGRVSGHSLEPSGNRSVDTTELHWLPLRFSAVYRFDWLWTRFGVPLTAYGKIGLDYQIWWVYDGSGSVAKSADGGKGYGGTFGFHAVAGVAFVLDWLAPEMEKSIDVEWGINNSYIFAEYMDAKIDGFGSSSSMDMGDRASFQFGIGLEF